MKHKRSLQDKEPNPKKSDDRIAKDSLDNSNDKRPIPAMKKDADIAAMHQQPGEKRPYKSDQMDEQDSDGSANAFEDK